MRCSLQMAAMTICVMSTPLMCPMTQPTHEQRFIQQPHRPQQHSPQAKVMEKVIPLKVRPKSTTSPPASGLEPVSLSIERDEK